MLPGIRIRALRVLTARFERIAEGFFSKATQGSEISEPRAGVIVIATLNIDIDIN